MQINRKSLGSALSVEQMGCHVREWNDCPRIDAKHYPYVFVLQVEQLNQNSYHDARQV